MGEFHYSDVLIEPVFSEKSNDSMNFENKYSFYVALKATKHDIMRAVKDRYEVEPVSVNVVNLPRKPKRAGRFSYQTAKKRKAIVKLAEGDIINDLREAL